MFTKWLFLAMFGFYLVAGLIYIGISIRYGTITESSLVFIIFFLVPMLIFLGGMALKAYRE